MIKYWNIQLLIWVIVSCLLFSCTKTGQEYHVINLKEYNKANWNVRIPKLSISVSISDDLTPWPRAVNIKLLSRNYPADSSYITLGFYNFLCNDHKNQLLASFENFEQKGYPNSKVIRFDSTTLNGKTELHFIIIKIPEPNHYIIKGSTNYYNDSICITFKNKFYNQNFDKQIELINQLFRKIEIEKLDNSFPVGRN